MTPIERAARALCQEITAKPYDGASGITQKMFQRYARAAIAAIREPSDAQESAGVTAPNYLEDQSSRRGCRNIYTAMIDAALAESQ